MENELKEILEFNINEDDFLKLNKELDKPFKSEIYYDNDKKTKLFEGKIINEKYEGRGIKYNYNEKIKYNGYFKNGKYEGFGRYYERLVNGEALIVGFFKNNFCEKGIMYRNNIKSYAFYFNDKDIGIGIEYFPNGNIKRKMKYHYYYIRLKPLITSYGVLYDKSNNIVYKGLLKELKPDNAKNISIYNEEGFEMYIGDISNYKYNGNGIIFYHNSNKIFFDGIIQMDNYQNGVIYDPKGNKIYQGKFLNNIPIEGKDLKVYQIDGKLKYQGDILDGKYDNLGKLYENGQIIYEGGFNKGKYNKYGEIFGKYVGEFLNGNYHGYGKTCNYEGFFENNLYEGKGTLYEDNLFYEAEFSKGLIKDGFAKIYKKIYLGKFLFFEGFLKNKKYEGEGILYYQNGNKSFEGNFSNGNILGKGIKYYINGSKKMEGIFNTLNSCDGLYYSPEGSLIYKGKIENGIPNECQRITIYHDNTNKIYEGEMNKGIKEGYGIEYFPFIKDMILYEGKFFDNYYIMENCKKSENNKCLINVTSYQRGYHSCELVEKLITNKVGSFGSSTESSKDYIYKYNGSECEATIDYFDDLYKRQTSLWYAKKSDIIIFAIKVDGYENAIDEEYIIRFFKNKKKNSLIYIVIKNIEKLEEGDIYETRNEAI